MTPSGIIAKELMLMGDVLCDQTADGIIQALKTEGYIIVPTKKATHAIVGRAPLILDDVGGGKDEFAVYIDGLTADEAGAIMKPLMTSKESV